MPNVQSINTEIIITYLDCELLVNGTPSPSVNLVNYYTINSVKKEAWTYLHGTTLFNFSIIPSL